MMADRRSMGEIHAKVKRFDILTFGASGNQSWELVQCGEVRWTMFLQPWGHRPVQLNAFKQL